jgi:hypothetical protein
MRYFAGLHGTLNHLLCKLDKLFTALRTAVDNDGTLDKEVTSYNDILMPLG